MRVLCHAQHFKGIGHFVRMHAIARGMSETHEVYLVDGGRPVPRRAGEHPAVQVLQARVRSVLVPNPDNSDQPPRARRLAKLGLATVIEGAAPPAGAIAAAIEEAMARPPLEHALDLDGVRTTRRIVEEMVAGAGPGSRP